MIVQCDECGARYRLDESKFQGKKLKARCNGCGNTIELSRKEQESGAGAEEPSSAWTGAADQASPSGPDSAETSSIFDSAVTDETSERAGESGSDSAGLPGAASPLTRPKGLGIRGKMFLLFVFIPIVLMIIASFLYIRQLERLQSMSTDESLKIVQEMAVTRIAQKARDVARQIDIYLAAHQNLEEDRFIRDPRLRRLAIQKIGEAGYTFMYKEPGQNHPGRMLIHIDRQVINADLSEVSGRTRGFVRTLKQAKGGNEASAYYKEKSPGGDMIEKYLFCTPVGGTDYVVASTSEVKPLTTPARVIKTRVNQRYLQVREQVLIVLGILVVLIFALVSWFGHNMSKRILSITDVAERISIGDLDAEIQVKGKDEISMLAASISRMQQSVSLAIKRLRKRL